MPLILHGVPISPFVRKALIVLLEKQIKHDLNPVSPFAPPENFKELSPLGRIPVLQDSDLAVPDSSAICHYLEKIKPSPALYPNAPAEFANALWIEEYADTNLASAIGMGVFRPLIVAPLMGKEPDVEGAREALKTTLPEHFAYFEKQLKGKEWFCADVFTIADIAVAVQLQNLIHCGYTLPADKYPHLSGFLKRNQERESFKTCLGIEGPILAQMGVQKFDLN